jgi:hypothetical protein
VDGFRDVIVLVGTAISALLGIVVLVILTRFTVGLFVKSQQVRAQSLDSRHFGVVLVCSGGATSGLIVAGAGALVCVIGAIVGAAIGVFFARLTPEWRDKSVGPWAGGAMFMVLAVSSVAVALVVRFNR